MSIDAQSQLIPEDLNNSYNAAKTLVLISELLQYVPIMHTQKVHTALNFTQALHKETLATVLNHPQSDLIEEIKKYKEENGSEKTNSENNIQDRNHKTDPSL